MRFPRLVPCVSFAVFAVLACGCGSGGGSSSSVDRVTTAATIAPSPLATNALSQPPAADARLQLAAGFAASVIANVAEARELAVLPNGDLLVGTSGSSIAIVPDADGPGVAGVPATFITLAEGPANGVAYGPDGAIYAATNTTIWKMPYAAGERSAAKATAIAHVRRGPVAPNSDGDVHATTSVAVSATTVYAGVGSSCNACVETDATRATVQQMHLDGSAPATLATRTRNPIALALDPSDGALWIGGAGQDGLAYGHPYEYFDSPTRHGAARVDYGWPQCEENRQPYDALRTRTVPDCAQTVAPAIAFPAYSTLVGAAFYPTNQRGAYAFPAAYRGGVFVTAHGSWHCCPATPPRVYYVPLSGGVPAKAVDWSDPALQSQQIVWGFGSPGSSSYIGRPTGIAVGNNGSLFVADDATGNIYRIRHV